MRKSSSTWKKACGWGASGGASKGSDHTGGSTPPAPAVLPRPSLGGCAAGAVSSRDGSGSSSGGSGHAAPGAITLCSPVGVSSSSTAQGSSAACGPASSMPASSMPASSMPASSMPASSMPASSIPGPESSSSDAGPSVPVSSSAIPGGGSSTPGAHPPPDAGRSGIAAWPLWTSSSLSDRHTPDWIGAMVPPRIRSARSIPGAKLGASLAVSDRTPSARAGADSRIEPSVASLSSWASGSGISTRSACRCSAASMSKRWPPEST
jgi:hypothetical protein